MLPWRHRTQRWYDQRILYSGLPDTLSYHLDNTVYTGGRMNWFYILVHLRHCHTNLITPFTAVLWWTDSIFLYTWHIVIPPWQHRIHLDNTVYTLTTLYTPEVSRADSLFRTTWHIGISDWQHCIHRWCDELILHSGPPNTLSYHLDNPVYSGGMINCFFILVHPTHFHTTLTTL